MTFSSSQKSKGAPRRGRRRGRKDIKATSGVVRPVSACSVPTPSACKSPGVPGLGVGSSGKIHTNLSSSSCQRVSPAITAPAAERANVLSRAPVRAGHQSRTRPANVPSRAGHFPPFPRRQACASRSCSSSPSSKFSTGSSSLDPRFPTAGRGRSAGSRSGSSGARSAYVTRLRRGTSCSYGLPQFLWEGMPKALWGFRPRGWTDVPLEVKALCLDLDWKVNCFPLTLLCLCPAVAAHLAGRTGPRTLDQIQSDLDFYAFKLKVRFAAYKLASGWTVRFSGHSSLPAYSLLIYEGESGGHVAPLRGRVPPDAEVVSSLYNLSDLHGQPVPAPVSARPEGVLCDSSPSTFVCLSEVRAPCPPARLPAPAVTECPADDGWDLVPDAPLDASAPFNIRSLVLRDALFDSLRFRPRYPRAYRPLPGVSLGPRRVLFDGYEEVVVVIECDRITAGFHTFTFRMFGGLLRRELAPRLPRPGFASRFVMSLAQALGRANTSAAHVVRPMDREVLTGLQFHRNLEQQTQLEAIHQASVLYNRQMRQPESSYDGDAVRAVMDLATMTRPAFLRADGSRTLYGGPIRSAYLWGYCFSCGGFSTRRMAGRICVACQGSRDGDPLVAAIRRGEHVATDSVPLRFPGVVNMSSQHPPLKSVRSIAGPRDVRVSGSTLEAVLTMPPRARLGPRLLGIGLNGAYPFCSSVGPRPLLEAILYRIFKDIPERQCPERPCFEAVVRVIDVLLPGFCDPCEPMSVFQWIRSYRVSRRRHALIRAHWQRVERGCNHQDYGKVGAFVKTEKLPWFKPVGGEPYVSECAYIARLIQAPHDEAHLDAGPFLKPLVHRLKSIWHEHNWIFYGSREPEVLDVWLSRISGCRSFFWADYSAFDATHSDLSWWMIEGLYSRIYPRGSFPQLWMALDAWREPKGKCKVRKEGVVITYQAPPSNASGRDDTALANALFNGLCLATAFAAELSGVEIEDLTPDHFALAERLCKISIVGDDSLVGCDFDVSQYDPVRHLRRFGLVVKSEHSSYLGAVTYLGQMPYFVGGGWVWGPTLGRCLYKAFWQLERDAHPVAWLRGVALQLSLFRHVPVLVEFAERVLLLTRGPITPVTRDPNRPWTMRDRPTAAWDPITLLHLSRRYGATPELILSDIALVKRVTTLPCVGRFPFLNMCVTQDDL